MPPAGPGLYQQGAVPEASHDEGEREGGVKLQRHGLRGVSWGRLSGLNSLITISAGASLARWRRKSWELLLKVTFRVLAEFLLFQVQKQQRKENQKCDKELMKLLIAMPIYDRHLYMGI